MSPNCIEFQKVILIPAYNPTEVLYDLIRKLIPLNAPIVVVNDGSNSPSAALVFEKIRNDFNEGSTLVYLFDHFTNLGKGRGIKSGLNFISTHPVLGKDLQGVVTADADGQHLPEDIHKMLQGITGPDVFILGHREFRYDLPLRSKVGNNLTKFIFKIITGKALKDTQTGLRALGVNHFRSLIALRGERYEYETNMLLYATEKNIPILEIPISTVYIDNNSSSHFNPLLDSMRIYFLLFRFGFSSIMTSILDYAVFVIAYQFGKNLWMSILVSRSCAALFNFYFNQKIVFKKSFRSFMAVRYFFLVAILGFMSYALISFATQQTSLPVYITKILVELILFYMSFVLQRDYVFKKNHLIHSEKNL